jgi:hypothetical protein
VGLGHAYIGGGFIRNYIWDLLHNQPISALNDIDVIYYAPDITDETIDRTYEEKLRAIMPGEDWSVKNQARMHLKNDYAPFTGIADALEHWTEQATAIAARIDEAGEIEIIAPFGVTDLLACIAQPTPIMHKAPERMKIYQARMLVKNWPSIWPNVTVYDLDKQEI